MNSMENFFNWVSKPVPKDEVLVWFNINNMNFEKVELYGDFFKSLNSKVIDTYFQEDHYETKIIISEENKKEHFEWCWSKTLEDFAKENINFNTTGEHKNYFEKFFFETFYNQKEKTLKDAIPSFLDEVFSLEKPFSKSDLEIMTEIYKLLEKNKK
jgi:hypothetical protein